MKNEDEIKRLEAELDLMRKEHIYEWTKYGSELSAGEMLRKEAELEKKIEKLKI